MAANGISTLPTKPARVAAKIVLAAEKRQAEGTIGYRIYNFYVASVAPAIGRPWAAVVSGISAIIGGFASTLEFNDPATDGGNATSSFTETIDGGAAIFV